MSGNGGSKFKQESTNHQRQADFLRTCPARSKSFFKNHPEIFNTLATSALDPNKLFNTDNEGVTLLSALRYKTTGSFEIIFSNSHWQENSNLGNLDFGLVGVVKTCREHPRPRFHNFLQLGL
ncbi:hypothetical protein Adt_46788 [Abeliophyllum distichum]|uniref:Uncharacterized protein n=1 Tax=Abeliophyllum distichum TaxID=126358 RepID=A0ABD1P110_9LAMI